MLSGRLHSLQRLSLPPLPAQVAQRGLRLGQVALNWVFRAFLHVAQKYHAGAAQQ